MLICLGGVRGHTDIQTSRQTLNRIINIDIYISAIPWRVVRMFTRVFHNCSLKNSCEKPLVWFLENSCPRWALSILRNRNNLNTLGVMGDQSLCCTDTISKQMFCSRWNTWKNSWECLCDTFTKYLKFLYDFFPQYIWRVCTIC